MEIKGIDISQWENGFKFSALRNSEYKFAILRGGTQAMAETEPKRKMICSSNFIEVLNPIMYRLVPIIILVLTIINLVKRRLFSSTKTA